MKTFTQFFSLTLFLTVGIHATLHAQTGCAAGTATETLDAGNSIIKLSSSGIWAFDLSGEIPAYQWPKQQGPANTATGILFTGNLWIGGFDDGGNLKLAAKTYGTDDNNGFWPGPIDEEGTTVQNCENWDRLFKVSKAAIQAVQADYADNQQLDDPIPASILGWPGKDNPFFNEVYGFDLPTTSSGLAPFFDRNGDARYDPMAGDYPEIKCADQAVWWVFNDVGNVNFVNSTSIMLEIQMMAYAYDVTMSEVYNSSFYDVKIINRGTEPLDSTYFGLWIDPDLGCPFDDYLGCVPEENLGFVYNADAVDGLPDGSCQDVPTYEAPPLFGIKLLQEPLDEFGDDVGMSSFTYYNSNGTPPGQQGPTAGHEFYNALAGRRSDNAAFIDPDGMPTKYLFSDNPADTPDGWSMCSEATPLADNRLVLSIGSFRMDPGAINNFTFAVVVQPQAELPCPDITTLIEAADLPTPANEGSFYCGLTVSTSNEVLNTPQLSTYPNPASDRLNFQFLNDENEKLQSVKLYRTDGKLMAEKDTILQEKFVFDVAGLATGMYFYKAQSINGNVYTGKVILE